LGEQFERFLAAGDEHDVVAVVRVAAGDGVAEARAGAEHCDRLGQGMHLPY
jgi:hypothetical protein